MSAIATTRRFADRSWPAGQSITGGQLVIGNPGPVTRTVTDGVTTANSTAVTSATANFQQADVGDTISGGSIPAGATIVSVQSATAVTISANATAAATAVSLTITVPVNPDNHGNDDVAYVAGAGATTVLGVALIDAIPFTGIITSPASAFPVATRVTVGSHGEFPVTYASTANVGQALIAAANGAVAPFTGSGGTADEIVGYATETTPAGAVGNAYIGR